MLREYTILQDLREKRPLPFPDYLPYFVPSASADSPRLQSLKLTVKKSHLLTGDYVLEGFETFGCIERKAHLTELMGNLCTPTGRFNFLAELDRLSTFSAPLLLLEDSCFAAIRRPPGDNRPAHPPAAVRDMLLALVISRRIPLLTFRAHSLRDRQTAASWAASFLITATLHSSLPPPGVPSCQALS